MILGGDKKQHEKKNEKLKTCKHHVTECKTLHEAIHGEEAVSTTDVIFFLLFLMMCFFHE